MRQHKASSLSARPVVGACFICVVCCYPHDALLLLWPLPVNFALRKRHLLEKDNTLWILLEHSNTRMGWRSIKPALGSSTELTCTEGGAGPVLHGSHATQGARRRRSTAARCDSTAQRRSTAVTRGHTRGWSRRHAHTTGRVAVVICPQERGCTGVGEGLTSAVGSGRVRIHARVWVVHHGVVVGRGTTGEGQRHATRRDTARTSSS